MSRFEEVQVSAAKAILRYAEQANAALTKKLPRIRSFFKVKLLRAYGGCLGAISRRRTR